MWRNKRGVDLLDMPEMAAFFERLDRVNQEELLALRAAWQATHRQEHEYAWNAVRVVGVDQGLSKEIGRVRDAAMAWSRRASDVIPYVFLADVLSWQQIKMEASEAIVDAALAVALGDRLDARVHDILIEPWLRATAGG
jgi:hypothetical protein